MSSTLSYPGCAKVKRSSSVPKLGHLKGNVRGCDLQDLPRPWRDRYLRSIPNIAFNTGELSCQIKSPLDPHPHWLGFRENFVSPFVIVGKPASRALVYGKGESSHRKFDATWRRPRLFLLQITLQKLSWNFYERNAE